MPAHGRAGRRHFELAHAHHGFSSRRVHVLRRVRRRMPRRIDCGARDESQVIGVAKIDQDRCLAFAQSGCRVCVDACPYGAISLDSSMRPVVDVDACNGCGACEFACPSNTYLSFAGGKQRGINVEIAREEA
mgnify:CR=1 FL=1